MFDNPLIIADSLALSASIIICALAAYRAFASRRVLATLLYRNRALWTGTVALITIPFEAWAIFLENTGSSVTLGLVPPVGTPEFYLFVILTAAFAAVAFAWIDSTIRVALELDFTHRDVVRWKKFRPVTGVALVVGTVVGQFATTDWELLTTIVLLVAAAAYLTAALAAGGSRVRDETMRRYMRWMGFVVGSIPLQLVTSYINPYLNFPLAIFAYFLYGMSTSLLKTAPLSAAAAEISASGAKSGTLRDQGPM
jgi:hypothetical protein